ncbi:GNAT family N-acetyltransferase [Nocardia sp. NPDC060259]|uniref:GNAT family N-acetyltransferase n=1 Tax=Nocardia sp. NPDC060259 TaxID=3347088 RepID=UPI0036512ED4
MGSYPVAVTLLSADEARQQMDAICDLYDEVFSVAPFVWPDGESQRHRKMMEQFVLDPTFGIVFAEATGQLAGCVYGVSLKPPTNWWDGFEVPVPDDVVREWHERTFAVIDLAVQQQWRRRGLGRDLMNTLLASRQEQRATLAVQPQAADAHAFYTSIGGWELLGRQFLPNAGYVHDRFDIYVKALGPNP